MSKKNYLLRSLYGCYILIISVLLISCGDSKIDEATKPDEATRLEGIAFVSDSSLEQIPEKLTVEFGVKKLFNDFSENSLSSVDAQDIVWSFESEDGLVIDTTSDNNSLSLSWTGQGEGLLTANYSSESKTYSATRIINVVERSLASIAISQIMSGDNDGCDNAVQIPSQLVDKCLIQFNAVGTYNNLETEVLTTAVEWSSENPTIADSILNSTEYQNYDGVNNYVITDLTSDEDKKGYFFGLSLGSFVVKATVGGIEGTTTQDEYQAVKPKLLSFVIEKKASILEKIYCFHILDSDH